jgi:TPR repeat protein
MDQIPIAAAMLALSLSTISLPSLAAPPPAPPGLVKAAERGDADAQYRLAKHYGASKDSREKKLALNLFERSADQGHPRAAFHAGVMYEQGRGHKKNVKKAMERYEEAANAGNAEAMFTLAKKYEEGAPGLKKDRKKAKNWYEKAVSKWEKNGPPSEEIVRHRFD